MLVAPRKEGEEKMHTDNEEKDKIVASNVLWYFLLLFFLEC